MALSDVYEAVKARMQELYPESEGRSEFVHMLGDESLLSRMDSAFPRAVWVLPRPGRVDFSRERVRRVGEKPGTGIGRQLNAMGVPVQIHIWTEEIEDWEEDPTNGRDAGVLTQYVRAMHEVISGVEWQILSGGWEPKTSTEVGYVFVLQAMFWFGVYDASSATVSIKDYILTKEIVS